MLIGLPFTISFGGLLNQDTTLDLNNKIFNIEDTVNSLNIGSGFNEYVVKMFFGEKRLNQNYINCSTVQDSTI